jgi:hypothetical protein
MRGWLNCRPPRRIRTLLFVDCQALPSINLLNNKGIYSGFQNRSGGLRTSTEPFVLQVTRPENCIAVHGPKVRSGSNCDSLERPTSAPLQVTPFGEAKLTGSTIISLWPAFCCSEPVHTDVPGEHSTLMDPDHVPQFQETFHYCLEARGL